MLLFVCHLSSIVALRLSRLMSQMLLSVARCLSLGESSGSFSSSSQARLLSLSRSIDRIRQEELVYVLQKLNSARLREGTLWASSQSSPSAAADSPLQLDTSLPLATLIRSTLLRSPLAHLYELHPLFTSLLSLAQTTPPLQSSYLPYRSTVGLSEEGELSFEGLPHGFKVKRTGQSSTSTNDESDILKLVLSCLEKVGSEIGAGKSF